jgi:hypothetical protein
MLHSGWLCLIPGRRSDFFLCHCTRPALGPTKSPTQWVLQVLSLEVTRWFMKLTSDLHQALKVRMCGATPPLPHGVVFNHRDTSLQCGAQVKGWLYLSYLLQHCLWLRGGGKPPNCCVYSYFNISKLLSEPLQHLEKNIDLRATTFQHTAGHPRALQTASYKTNQYIKLKYMTYPNNVVQRNDHFDTKYSFWNACGFSSFTWNQTYTSLRTFNFNITTHVQNNLLLFASTHPFKLYALQNQH